jgi:hypothetical protein
MTNQEVKMTNSKSMEGIAEMKHRTVNLSTLWVFVTLNFLYCDFMTLMNHVELKQILTGHVGSITITQGFLLGSALLMEIPIAMVLLSMVLKYKANRWANMIAGTLMTVVQAASLFIGTAPTLHYMFFSIVEISCLLFIVRYAFTWSDVEDSHEMSASVRQAHCGA